MTNYPKNFQNLINARIDVWTAPFSDDASCIKRDTDWFNKIFDAQSEYTIEQIDEIVGKIWNGELTRKDVFDE